MCKKCKSISESLVKHAPMTLALRFLNELANSQTGYMGDGNYIFKYKKDEIIIDEETKNLKMVDVLANDEDNEAKKYVIECYMITADLFWGKEIIVKNATKRKLKTEVTYQTRDFTKEKDRK